jgi:hypothetical protein
MQKGYHGERDESSTHRRQSHEHAQRHDHRHDPRDATIPFGAVRSFDERRRISGSKGAKHDTHTRTMANARFEMKLCNTPVGITKRSHQSQHHRSIHSERKLHANGTSLRVTIDAMYSAATTTIASATITPSAHDARGNCDQDVCADPFNRDFDRMLPTRFSTCIQRGSIDDTAECLRHVSSLTPTIAFGKW